jgi:CRP-like cAMP-binding protein
MDREVAIFGELKTGDFFGEFGVVNNEPNPWTIEVTSKTVHVLTIHKTHFDKYFGGT